MLVSIFSLSCHSFCLLLANRYCDHELRKKNTLNLDEVERIPSGNIYRAPGIQIQEMMGLFLCSCNYSLRYNPMTHKSDYWKTRCVIFPDLPMFFSFQMDPHPAQLQPEASVHGRALRHHPRRQDRGVRRSPQTEVQHRTVHQLKRRLVLQR